MFNNDNGIVKRIVKDFEYFEKKYDCKIFDYEYEKVEKICFAIINCDEINFSGCKIEKDFEYNNQDYIVAKVIIYFSCCKVELNVNAMYIGD